MEEDKKKNEQALDAVVDAGRVQPNIVDNKTETDTADNIANKTESNTADASTPEVGKTDTAPVVNKADATPEVDKTGTTEVDKTDSAPVDKYDSAPADKYADGVKSWQEAADYYGYNPKEYMRPYDASYLDPGVKYIQDRMAAIKSESDEERKKRERREASRKIIKSVGDGLSAIANLVLTDQGAPSMYDPNTQGQMAKYEQRLREAAANRDKDNAERYKLLLAANQLAEQRARLQAAGMDAQRSLMTQANKDIQDKKMIPYKLAALEDEARAKKAKADKAEIDAQYAPQVYADKHQVAGSQADKNNRTGRGGGGGRKSSGGGKRSGGSGSGGKVTRVEQSYDEDTGKKITVKKTMSEQEYERQYGGQKDDITWYE